MTYLWKWKYDFVFCFFKTKVKKANHEHIKIRTSELILDIKDGLKMCKNKQTKKKTAL